MSPKPALTVRIATRRVPSRVFPSPSTWMAELRTSVNGAWQPKGRTSGHSDRRAAVEAARKLAARRGFVIDDTRLGWHERTVEEAADATETAPDLQGWKLQRGAHCLIATTVRGNTQIVAHFTNTGGCLRIVTAEPYTAPTIPMVVIEALAADARARGWLPTAPSRLDAFLRQLGTNESRPRRPLRPELLKHMSADNHYGGEE